jgi:hypothetical protein
MDEIGNESRQQYRKKLKELKRVANQNADMHSWESERYSFWDTIFVCSGLISSAFLLTMAFASEDFINRTVGLSPDYYKWCMSILAFLTFSTTLVLLAWRPASKSASHKEAVSRYSRSRHKMDMLLDEEKPICKADVEFMIEEYLKTDDLPKIKNSRFNRLKQKHLIKVAISKELSKNPYRKIREIKSSLPENFDNK